MVDLRTKAARRRDYALKNKLLNGKPEPVSVVPFRVRVGATATARGVGFLHRKTARALPMRSWVAEV